MDIFVELVLSYVVENSAIWHHCRTSRGNFECHFQVSGSLDECVEKDATFYLTKDGT
jgi:hypothetical protein